MRTAIIVNNAPKNSSLLRFTQTKLFFDAYNVGYNYFQDCITVDTYEEAEKILIDELPVIPLYTYTRTYLLSERVKNWQNNILDTNPYQFLSLE